MDKEELKTILAQVKGIMEIPRALTDIDGRDHADQQLTSYLATLGEIEANLEQEAEQLQAMQEGSIAKAENVKKASEAYKWFKVIKNTRESIIEHIRGLRSHSKREYSERTIQ